MNNRVKHYPSFMSPYYSCDMKHSLTSHKIIITLNTNKQAYIHVEKENNTEEKEHELMITVTYLTHLQKLKQEQTLVSCKLSELKYIIKLAISQRKTTPSLCLLLHSTARK